MSERIVRLLSTYLSTHCKRLTVYQNWSNLYSYKAKQINSEEEQILIAS
jgi:hypothetical protein